MARNVIAVPVLNGEVPVVVRITLGQRDGWEVQAEVGDRPALRAHCSDWRRVECLVSRVRFAAARLPDRPGEATNRRRSAPAGCR
jgi:hypothetical protein